MPQFYPKITAKQEGGDDGYCYVIRIDGAEYINGLTRRELPHYKQGALLLWYSKLLRDNFCSLYPLQAEDLARERIKLNRELNYKAPRKPIEGACCKWAMELELTEIDPSMIWELTTYCPIHGETVIELVSEADLER